MKIKGDKELIAAFKQCDVSTTDKVEREMNKGVKKIEMAAKSQLKKGHGVKTGNLRRSITSEVERQGNDRIIGKVGTDVFYAPYQELGTSGKHPIRPLHYITIAWKANQETIIQGLRSIIRSLKL